MTLIECVRQYGLSGCMLSDCYVVYPDTPFPVDLWHCSDYVVSSTSGGCVWLVRRLVRR
jgi:hypothetical protein